MTKKKTYDNDSISSLKGADRVRKRPGVIFGSDGLEGCEHAMFEILSNAIENAQKQVESRNFQTRKTVLEYDDVMNVQREIIYKQRRQVLDGENMGSHIRNMLHRWIEESVRGHQGEHKHLTAESWQLATEPFRGLFFPPEQFQYTDEELAAKSTDALITELSDQKVYLDGASKLLRFPEYRDTKKAQTLLDYMEDDRKHLLPATRKIDGIQFFIGPENGENPLSETSAIYAKYDIGKIGQGAIGIVGPTRMDYAKLSAQLSRFAKGLNKLIAETFLDEKDGNH